MKPIVKTTLSAFVLCLMVYSTNAQNLQPGNAGPDRKMLSSEASGGGLSNLYSPNLYDGSAQVTIPIFEYKTAEGADFGVSLGYNTKGVLVNEIASDVGLHWTTYNGPSIIRVLKDLPDEINLLDGDTMTYMANGAIGYWDPASGVPPPPSDSIPINPFWAFKGRLAFVYESGSTIGDSLVYRDGEADDFIVSLGGTSFTFNFASDGTIFTIPKKNIKVTALWDGQPITAATYNQQQGGTNNLLSFQVEDEQGNKYVFERSSYRYQAIYDRHGKGYVSTDTRYSTSWRIKEITLSNGSKIRYNFETFVVPANAEYISNSKGELNEGTSSAALQKETDVILGLTISRLLDISYPNGSSVVFNYNPVNRGDGYKGALREIKVSVTGNCLRYVMQQDYFTATDTLGAAEAQAQNFSYTLSSRLRLNGIRLVSCDSTVSEPYYSFGYSTVQLPYRMSERQDFFGYYNGPTSAVSGIPAHQKASSVDNNNNITYNGTYGRDRNANVQYAQAGILKMIHNAYGGSAVFYYGAHQLSNVLQGLPTDPQFLGVDANDGLRLDSIMEADLYHTYSRKVTRFAYSGGQRFLTGGYFHNFVLDAYFPPQGPDYKYFHFMFTNTYLTAHQFVNGSNHGYTDVTVTTVNGENGTLLGRKTIKFSNFQDAGGTPKYTIVGGGKHYYQYPYPDKQFIRDWELGLPLEVTEYDQNNRIVQQTINKYEASIDSTSSMGKVENKKKSYVLLRGKFEPGMHAWAFRLHTDSYRPYRGKALLKATTIKKYISDVAFIKDSTAYSYDSHDNLDNITTINSKGDVVNTSQVYNYEVQQPNATLLAMTSAGLEKIVGMERRTSGKILDATVNTYNYQNGKLLPKDLYKLTIAEPMDYASFASSVGSSSNPYNYINTAFTGASIANFDKVSTVTLTDVKGNPLENQLLGLGIYKAMVWDTVTDQKLAEITNARYNEIACTSFDHILPGSYTGFEWLEQGRVRYQHAGLVGAGGTMAGRSGYRLFSSGQGSSIICSALTPNKPYKIGFWAKSGVPGITGGGVSSFNLTTPLPSPVNGWTYYSGTFTPTNNTEITFTSGTTIYIDELRIYPVGAQMQSQTYLPLFGIDSQTDGTGRITKFEYDKLGRQTIVRNQEGQIISKKEIYVQASE